jgi:hypothetical protein
MVIFHRRPLLIAAALAGLLMAATISFLFSRSTDLRTRLAAVTVGMPRADVEALLGRPEVTLRRAQPGTGEVMLWVDQFWQVEVVADGDGRVIKTDCTRSHSLYWRTVGRVLDLPN